MQRRMLCLVTAVAIFQVIAAAPSRAQNEKQVPDGSANQQKGLKPFFTEKCGTRERPAPAGTVCGTTADFKCNGIDTRCCPVSDNECRNGR
jgi:hypothetical protein